MEPLERPVERPVEPLERPVELQDVAAGPARGRQLPSAAAQALDSSGCAPVERPVVGSSSNSRRLRR